jgi:phosphoribosylglycinamide formyltransferase-1
MLPVSDNFARLTKKEQIAVFASGAGTNAQALMEHFATHPNIGIARVVTNRKDAGVIEKANAFNIPVVFTSNQALRSGDTGRALHESGITSIVLAGFLLMIPGSLIKSFPDRIINIHPSLLPLYGGKGMYGGRVHEAVLRNGEHQSGITIHLVNEEYDKGRIIAQFTCTVLPSDTMETLQERIHELEHAHFSKTVESYLSNL